MEEILKTAVVQVPATAILAIVVIAFVKYIKSRDVMMRDINQENLAAREISRIVIEKNTVSQMHNAERMDHNTFALNEMTHIFREYLKVKNRN